jgi:hypothetical protein
VVRTAPLRQWEQALAFDSAGECEAARAKISGAARNALKPGGEIEELRATLKGPKSTGDDKAIFSLLIYKRFAEIDGRCIASDDPRLTQSEPGPRVQPPSAPPVQLRPSTPEFKAAVTACRSIVRQETNSQFARSGITIVESTFDAYVQSDGTVYFLGTKAENFSFAKCMNDRGYPLEQR